MFYEGNIMKVKKQFNNLKAGAKKVFVGMLILCLISTATGIGSIFAYADECENHYAESYTCYDESEHVGYCINCGEEIRAGHSFDSEGRCNVCGYDPGPAPDPENVETGEGDGTGAADPVAPHDHTFGQWQQADSDGHVHYCEICGESETAPHDQNVDHGEVLYNGDDTHYRYECSVCGYKFTEACSFDSYAPKDDTSHYKRCSVCGNTIEEPCVFEDYISNGDGTMTGTCVCGNTETVPEEGRVQLRGLRGLLGNAPSNGDGYDESDYDGPYVYSDFYTARPTIATGLTYTGTAQDLFGEPGTTGTLKSSDTLRDEMYITETTFIPIQADTEGRKKTDAGTHEYSHTISYTYKDDTGAEHSAYATGKFTVTIAKADFSAVIFSPASTDYVELPGDEPYYRLKFGNVDLYRGTDYTYTKKFGDNISANDPPKVGDNWTYTFSANPSAPNFDGSVDKTVSVGDVAVTFNGQAGSGSRLLFNGQITVAAPAGYTVSNSVNGDYAASFVYNVLGESTLDVYARYADTGKIVHKTQDVKISRDLIGDDFIQTEPEFYDEVEYTGSDVALASSDVVINQQVIDDNQITDFKYHYEPVAGSRGSATADNTSPKETNKGKYEYNLVFTFKDSTKTEQTLSGTASYTSLIVKNLTSADITYTPLAEDYQSLDPTTVPDLTDAFNVKDGNTQLQKDTHYSIEATEPETAPYETGKEISFKFTGITNATGNPSSFYRGTVTKTIPVATVPVKLNGADQVSKYEDEVEFTAEGYTISTSASGTFNTKYVFSEPCDDYTLTLYFKKIGTSRVVKQDIKGLNIGGAAAIKVLYDGEEELKPFYFDSVRLSASGYKVSLIKNGEFNENYTLDYDGTKAMQPVPDFHLYFKDNTTGLVYAKKISGINLFETPDLDILYNGDELKDWYNDTVAVTAAGYLISDKDDSGFVASYKISGSGTVIKKLYFMDKTTRTMANGGNPYTIVVNIDRIAPTGSITLNSTTSNSFINTDSVLAYVNSAQSAAIASSDDLSGVDYVHYYVSDTFYSSASDLVGAVSEKSAAWRNYSDKNQPTLTRNKNNYIYASIHDKAGNETFISLGSIIYDTVIPKMTAGKVAPSETDGSNTVVGFAGSDSLSGVNRFKLLYNEKKEGKNDPPSKEHIFDDGETVWVKEEQSGSSVASLTIEDIDSEKVYMFYFAAVDRAGNISDILSQEVKGSDAVKVPDKKAADAAKSAGDAESKPSSGLAPAPSGIAGSGSGSGDKSGSSGKSTKESKDKKEESPLGDKDREINRDPYIADATGSTKIGINETRGWSRITNEIKKADKGAVVEVEMAGLSTVPDELFDSMDKKDVEVKLNMAENVKWEIKGEQVSNIKRDVDMGVRLGSRNIPQQVLTNVTGTYPHIEFSNTQKGDLGFEATIAVPVGDTNKGMHATLYHYDEVTKELTVADTVKVDDQGIARFPITNASDYTIVISPDELMTGATTDVGMGTLENSGALDASKYLDGAKLRLTDVFRIRGSMRIWLFVVALLSAAICAVILMLPSLQLGNRDDSGDLF